MKNARLASSGTTDYKKLEQEIYKSSNKTILDPQQYGAQMQQKHQNSSCTNLKFHVIL